MQDIQTYSNVELNANIRTVLDSEGNTRFCAKDVAVTLGYVNPADAITRHCRGVVKRYPIVDALGRTQEAVFITEPDLYRLISHSKLPAAERFEAWIYEEVLPSIRRRGGYMVAAADETPEETMARALLIANDALKKKDARIAELEPKAFFADAVNGAKDACPVDHLAKMLRQNGFDIGRNRLFALLRKDGYLCTRGESYNLPTQRAMDMGLFCIRESVHENPDGTSHLWRTTKVTGKGQRYFIDRYCQNIVTE